MSHLVLLGDSTLDNGLYVGEEPDTHAHLQRALGPEWTVELLARDGARIGDLGHQLRQLPAAPPIAVLSVGGNDAIEHIDLLDPRPTVTTTFLAELATIAEAFGRAYAAVVDRLLARVARLVVCTIYEPPVASPAAARLAGIPLAVLDDRIIRIATERSLDVVELRAVCTDPADFVLEIEPSARGARKIGAALAAAVRAAPGPGPSRIFAA